MPKGQGFKKTGGGPKYGSFSFPSGAGFTHSGTNKQNVKGYTRSKPKYAHGGPVYAPQSSSSSALTRRTKPVTGFDKEAGGKGPLRPGFNRGGKACYAEGGKVATTGAAIKMMKELMKRGNSAEDAASKAARRYGVPPSAVKAPSGPTGGGGMPADKQMLAKGGRPMPMKGGRILQGSPPAGIKGGRILQGSPPADRAYGPMPAPQGQKVPMAAPTGVTHHGGYGSFGRRPVVR